MYTVFKTVTDINTSHDIWEGTHHDEHCTEMRYKTLQEAKRECLKNIDADIAFLRKERKRIAALKKSDTQLVHNF